MRHAILTVIAGALLAGCGTGDCRLLLDARAGCSGRNHFVLVDDPFGGSEQAGRGTGGANGLQKMVLLSERGFFAMPSDREAWEVVIRLAVKGERGVRVMLVAGEKGHASYHRTLDAAGRWCDLQLPLTGTRRIPEGARIHDITIWQKDTGPDAVLYVQKARLRRVRKR